MDKNKLLIIYKLLGDLLFILLLFFGLSLVADNLVSGIVSSHISFLKIIFLITLNLTALYAIGTSAGVHVSETRPNKKTTAFLAVVGTLIIFVGLIKLNIYFSFSFLLLSLASMFFLWRMFFEK